MLEGKIPLITVKEMEINSHMIGFHVYKTVWEPYVGKKLQAEMDQQMLLVKMLPASKETIISLDASKRQSGRFAKTIFLILCVETN